MIILDFSFKLALWFLLTADASLTNGIIGICVALLLPSFGQRLRKGSSASVWKVWLQMLWKILLAIPRAYIEAIEMMLHPHEVEMIESEKKVQMPTRGLLFLDIFLITFTPKTIVVDYAKGSSRSCSYLIHSVSRRPSS